MRGSSRCYSHHWYSLPMYMGLLFLTLSVWNPKGLGIQVLTKNGR